MQCPFNLFFLFSKFSVSFCIKCDGQQQKFRVTPHDLQVLEGSEAMLRCEVSNLAGQVQWTKDGFALGLYK